MRQVRRERTSFRDMAWSLHTRLYGWDCPWFDLDRVAYFNKEPVALIEDRGEGGVLYDKGKANILAISRLARRFALPTFFHQYARDFSWHKIKPLTHFSKMFKPKYGDFDSRLSDTAYCAWEHQIRGVAINLDTAEQIIDSGKRDLADVPESRLALIPMDNDLQMKIKLIELSPADRLRLRLNLAEVMRELPS